MFEGYFGGMVLNAFKIIGMIAGVQLFIYWLIDKYTKLNFPIMYRIGLSIIMTPIIIKVLSAIILIATEWGYYDNHHCVIEYPQSNLRTMFYILWHTMESVHFTSDLPDNLT